jgi:hypothetical protein
VDAFIQTNGRVEFPLKLRVRINIIPPQRLLDHDQVKSIQLLQQRRTASG